MFVIENPSPISRFMIDGTLPLSSTPASAIPVISTTQLPTRPVIISSTRMHAFHYPHVKLYSTNHYLLLTNCSGDKCGTLGAMKAGVAMQTCSCNAITSRGGTIVLLSQLKLKVDDITSFHVTEFTSKSFTLSFFRGAQFPAGITVEILTERRTFDDILESIDNQTEYVNQHGGYDVVGWVNRGKILDRGVDQPLPVQRNDPKKKVESGNLIYNLSSVTPASLSNDEQTTLEGMKYNAMALV